MPNSMIIFTWIEIQPLKLKLVFKLSQNANVVSNALGKRKVISGVNDFSIYSV